MIKRIAQDSRANDDHLLFQRIPVSPQRCLNCLTVRFTVPESIGRPSSRKVRFRHNWITCKSQHMAIQIEAISDFMTPIISG